MAFKTKKRPSTMKKQGKLSISLLSLLGCSLLYNGGTITFAQASEGNQSEDIMMKSKKDALKTEKKAKELLYQAPESNALTKSGEKELKKHYVEKYMPVEGCSLVEELPKTSDIHYVPPKPKPKPKPKAKVKSSQPVVLKKESVVAQEKKKSETKTVVKTTITKSEEKSTVDERVSVQKEANVSYDTGSGISMSADDRMWLERLVEAESGGEPYEGRLAVATIIANRVSMPEFPNSVIGVIKAPNQFSPFIDGSINRKVPSAETKRAVAEVFDKGVRTLPSDAAYFCTTAIASNSWIGQTRPFIKSIGHHSFYKK